MFDFKKIRLASVQTCPVFFDTNATVDKACFFIKEAANNGASLIAFPEVFICAYPYWNWIMNPIEGSKWFKKLYLSSITADGPEVDKLKEIARAYGINVVIGINEKEYNRVGTLYNTSLIISDKGELLGKHRKLVPTWAEKLTWAGGDGSSLRVYNTSFGPLGTLICGENTNTLARYSLLAQGELIHVASYIALPVAPVEYNMAEAIKIRAAAHSFEGKIFTVVSCSTISDDMIQMLEKDVPNAREILTKKNSTFTGFIDMNGQVIGKPLIDDEGIVYADVDLEDCIQPKQMHDILGHYNRFDVFELKVNKKEQQNISFLDKNDLHDNQFLDLTNVKI